MKNKDVLSRLHIVFLLALISCFLWGSAVPSIKKGYEFFSISESDVRTIILFAGLRFFLAGVLVILFQTIAERKFTAPPKKAFPAIFKLSLAQTIVQYVFYYVGLMHTSGVACTILSGSGGFISIVLVSLVFHLEKLTKRKITGCILGLSGILVMNISFSGGNVFHFSLNGEAFILIAQISYAVSGILMKKYSQSFSTTMLSGYQFMFGSALMTVFAYLSGGRLVLPSHFMPYFLLLYLALISAVAYTIWGLLLKYNPVSRVVIFTFLVPIFGVFLSALFLSEWDEALRVNNLIALFLVSFGIFIVNKSGREKDVQRM